MIRLNVLTILEEQGRSKYWIFNELNKFEPMSYTNFNNIVENKTKSIKYDNIDKFCKILNCEPNKLFTRE